MVGTEGNHLAGQGSPYLREHAGDPVDWYPWSDEAFSKARKEDKPLFISIGYSTCHWCHVMQQESFKDPEVSKLMNDAFVCIKVDREERPDIDSTYMKVCQMMTRSGGWPLTIIATLDKKPFFAATYIPKESRFEMVGMVELIPRIEELWKNDRDSIEKNAESVAAALSKKSTSKSDAIIDESTLNKAFSQMSGSFDFDYGGFGEAPKFPMALNLLFIMRYWHHSKNKIALKIVERALECMRLGGIYDQIGGGFHRYATDAMWNVPHFEKMLYDNALLATLYLEAYQATKKSLYKETATETIDFVLREMSSVEGSFYTAIDADSEGQEGKFYTFSYEEVEKAFSKEQMRMFIAVYPLQKGAGQQILHMDDRIELGGLAGARKKLLELRDRKKRPNTDEKVLAGNNALMISALAKAYQVLNKEAYYDAARKAANFIASKMIGKDGKLHHVCNDKTNIGGYLDDYALVISAFIDLYQAKFEVVYLEHAVRLSDYMLKHFADKDGGFYFTADNADYVIARDKPLYDNATPSGNSAALYALIALSRVTGNFNLEDAASTLVRAFSKAISEQPSYAPYLLCGLSWAIWQSYEVLIAPKEPGDAERFISEVRKEYRPDVFLMVKGAGLSNVAGFTKEMGPIDGKTAAYVCTKSQCERPVTSPEEMERMIPK